MYLTDWNQSHSLSFLHIWKENILFPEKPVISFYLNLWDSLYIIPIHNIDIFSMVAVAQLVRAPDCGSGGRGFETHQPPIK